MYKSPITVLQEQMRIAYENEVVKGILRTGVEVDKDELINALKYDRQQYEKGYEDGYNQCKANILNALGIDWRDDE